MQPVLRLPPTTTSTTLLEQIRGPEHRSSSEMPRVDRHDERILAELRGKVLGDVLCMCEVVVHADERGRDVGLLV